MTRPSTGSIRWERPIWTPGSTTSSKGSGSGTGLAEVEVSALSGGQEAKVALAAIELSQFDITLLDEPTNDLDFEGLGRLETWVRSRRGGMVIVSHDRDFLERSVTTVLELDPHTRSAREYGGGWQGYLTEREHAGRHATEAYERYDRQRRQLEGRAERQRQWATSGVRRESRNPRDNDKAQRDFRINRTEKLASKARQTERAMESLEVVEKPFEGWDLRFTIEEAARAGDVVVRLDGAVIERGSFRMGPLDVEIDWGERVALTGANGTGKSTLVSALLGTLPLTAGERWMGPSVVVGELGQDRRAMGGAHDLVRTVTERCGLPEAEARSLLAKFGLDADHVTRPSSSLSPGERTRAELAMFQARGVNFLVLDEPTNHLDLPAIEQLESALAGFGGTLLLVSHDRQLLGSVDISRSIELAVRYVRGPVRRPPAGPNRLIEATEPTDNRRCTHAVHCDRRLADAGAARRRQARSPGTPAADPHRGHRPGGCLQLPGPRARLRGQHDRQRGVPGLRPHRGQGVLDRRLAGRAGRLLPRRPVQRSADLPSGAPPGTDAGRVHDVPSRAGGGGPRGRAEREPTSAPARHGTSSSGSWAWPWGCRTARPASWPCPT